MFLYSWMKATSFACGKIVTVVATGIKFLTDLIAVFGLCLVLGTVCVSVNLNILSPFKKMSAILSQHSESQTYCKCYKSSFFFVWFFRFFVFCFFVFPFSVSFLFGWFHFRMPPKEKFRREFGIAMKCCSADEDGRRRRQNRTTHNLSPSPSVVTSLTRTPKQQHQQRQSAQQLGLFGISSSQQPRRSSTKSGNSSPIIFKGDKNGSTPSEAETILLCTMNSSAYTHVSTVDE